MNTENVTLFVRRNLPIIIAIVIVLVLASAYELGYRAGPGISIGRVGYVSVQGLPKGANVYVDNALQGTASKAGTLSLELVSGTHSVIVGAEGKYPWSTNLSVNSNTKVSISPILVNSTLAGKALTGQDKVAALAAIASTTIPTQSNPIVLKSQCATVYISNNELIEDPATSTASAEFVTGTPSCTPAPYLCIGGSCEPTIIYSPLAKIDAVFPFPGRQDAVVILLDHSLFAIALDPRSPQFFAPVGHGHNPAAGMLPDGSIVISDGGTVSKISI